MAENLSESCKSTSTELTAEVNSKKHNRKLDAYNEVLFRLKDNEEAKIPTFEDELWYHFNRLPARYAMDVNVERANHVLLHKKMLEAVTKDKRLIWHVERVEGHAITPSVSENANLQDVSDYKQILHLHPMFGSSANLEALASETDCSNSKDNVSSASLVVPRLLHEVTVAADDRPKLLNCLTSSLGEMNLNIEELHAFSTNDGFTLDVFIVVGEKYKNTLQLMDDLDREMEKIKSQLQSKCPPLSVVESTQAQDIRQFDHVQIPTDESDSQLQSKGPPLSDVEELAQARNTRKSDHVQIPTDEYDVWEIIPSQLQKGPQIASGTYGELFRGTYCSQDVAIKTLNHERMTADMVQEFGQEVYIMRKIRHKNVVQFIGAHTSAPDFYIVTEFMSGGSVFDFLHIHKGSFKLPALIRAAMDISKGMNYLNQNNIIHRDLKTANLLMDENQVVKVADFGAARVKGQKGVMTAETGTYRWMAPEVIEHKPHDQKADVFSFGVALWEMLTGEIPYEQYTPLQAAVGVVKEGLRPTIPKTTPPKLARLIENCWQHDPKKRPDFTEILKTLQKIAKEVKDDSSGGLFSALRRNH